MSRFETDYSARSEIRQPSHRLRRSAQLQRSIPWFRASLLGAFAIACLGLTWWGMSAASRHSSSRSASTTTVFKPLLSALKLAPAADFSAPEDSAKMADPLLALKQTSNAGLQYVSSLTFDEAQPEHGNNAESDGATWRKLVIRGSDTLSHAFARAQLAYKDAIAIAHLDKYGKQLIRRLRTGDVLAIKADEQGHVVALKYQLDPIQTLEIRASDDGYSGQIEQAELDEQIDYAAGSIFENFSRDAHAAGLSYAQILQLVDIFESKIDFAYDIHQGNHFAVAYIAKYKDGRKVANGEVLAASFQTSKGRVRAVRFTNDDNQTGYYQPDGSSPEGGFIRTPVNYTRISSPFNLARKHPVLHRIRAHKGTDYAAPTGTPIHATQAGRITFRGRKGGYGNLVIIDHGNGITTRYGHMSRFARGQRVGSYVEQGATIGHVGATGMATGPHLHYEFRVNGTPKNPQTVDLPGAPPVSEAHMAAFKAHAQPLLAQLAELEPGTPITVARNEQRDSKR